MQSINGYYNGQEFVPLDNVIPKKNQKVIITFLDDYIDSVKAKPFQKYVGKLDQQSFVEITQALKDCEKVDADEW